MRGGDSYFKKHRFSTKSSYVGGENEKNLSYVAEKGKLIGDIEKDFEEKLKKEGSKCRYAKKAS